MEQGSELLADGLAEALNGRRCVSAWLGYSDPLFLGFGQELLPDPGRPPQPKPRYELQTNFADWTLAGPGGTSVGLDGVVGRPVVRWELDNPARLTVWFTDGVRLRVVPWQDTGEAWALVLSGGRVVVVACDGRAWTAREDEPIQYRPRTSG